MLNPFLQISIDLSATCTPGFARVEAQRQSLSATVRRLPRQNAVRAHLGHDDKIAGFWRELHHTVRGVQLAVADRIRADEQLP